MRLISDEKAKEMIKNHRSDFTTEYDYRTARACINAVPSVQLSRIERELHGKTPEEQYKILYQIMFEYANTFNDARRAVIDWLGE